MATVKNFLATGSNALAFIEAAHRWGPSLLTILGLSGITGWSAFVAEPVQEYSPLSWVLAALVGGLCGALLIWLWASLRTKLAYANLLNRSAKEDNRINILETTFTREKINLNDFRLPIPKPHYHKIFNDCFIVGPANVVCRQEMVLRDATFSNCDYVVLKDDALIYNAIPFENLTIAGGTVTGITFLIPQRGHHEIMHLPGVNWITDRPA